MRFASELFSFIRFASELFRLSDLHPSFFVYLVSENLMLKPKSCVVVG